MSKLKKSALLIFIILFIDQALKIWIKTNMYFGQSIPVFDWFIIHFTQNNGMAFGMEFGGEFGKMALSVFRIIAVIAIGWYIVYLAKHKAPIGLIMSISMICAGALGNIIDSAFYGMIFNDPKNFTVAEFMPEAGGYATFLHGKVVDMFYFPIIKGNFPDWFPLWGGESFVFFRPVFNIADSAITIGVFIIILFQRKYLQDEFYNKPESTTAEKTVEGEVKPENV